MKKKRASKRSNSIAISLKRRWLILFYRAILFLKLLVLLVIGLFMFTGCFDAYKKSAKKGFDKYAAQYGFVLENIIIGGQENTPYKDIVKALRADKGDSIFSVEMQEVKERLEDTTWVQKAIVERRLPSTIYITLVEREPIAIWQFRRKLYLVDSEGNRIIKYSGEGFSDLIHVVGQDANIYASNLLSEINKYPNLATKIKSSVRYGNRRWDLYFEQNIIVKMPESGFSDAYKYLHLINKDQKLFYQNYKILDLRDANKYYLEKI